VSNKIKAIVTLDQTSNLYIYLFDISSQLQIEPISLRTKIPLWGLSGEISDVSIVHHHDLFHIFVLFGIKGLVRVFNYNTRTNLMDHHGTEIFMTLPEANLVVSNAKLVKVNCLKTHIDQNENSFQSGNFFEPNLK
jgi:hypothetical protein